MKAGFWEDFDKPIVGLSPMDGVTDAAFRYMVCSKGKPDLVMTEFTNVEGLARDAVKMMVAFLYNEIERSVVAQIYGVEVDSFYKATVMLCELGFDGVDINMGCPANAVAKHGSGAGLIQTPELAKEIVRSCKRAAKDWSEGFTMEEAGVPEGIRKKVEEMKVGTRCAARGGSEDEGTILAANTKSATKRELKPISVKTRIGYDKVVTEEWMKHLLETSPANISLHGRTLRQMYMGRADWEEIGKAGALCRAAGISILGNGDISSLQDAHEKIEQYGLNGVLIGRATFGNPWVFSGHEPTITERFDAVLEHNNYFEKLAHVPFHNIKKHLSWYCKGFEGVKALRMELMQTNSHEEVRQIVKKFRFEHSI